MAKAPSTYKYLPAELADRIGHLGLTVRRPVEGPVQGLHRSPHLGSSVEFAEYRQYVEGDPIQFIDWAVYARSDRYVIRRFQDETNLRAYLLLDTSESLRFQQEGLHSKMDYAAFLAAALMYVLINQGDVAGLMTFDARVRDRFAPCGTLEGLRPMLLHLETVQPAGRSDIEAAIHEATRMIRSRSLVILVSDLLQDPRQILRGIRHLHHDGHEVMVLHVLDGVELRLSLAGVLKLKELETGRRMIVDLDDVREVYRQEVQRYLETLRRGCADCQAAYHVLDTRVTIEDALHRRILAV